MLKACLLPTTTTIYERNRAIQLCTMIKSNTVLAQRVRVTRLDASVRYTG